MSKKKRNYYWSSNSNYYNYTINYSKYSHL